MPNSKICSIDGCGKPVIARGWCRKHLGRWYRYGDPLFFKGTAIGSPMRFLTEAIAYPGGDECVLWPFSKSGGGYAMVSCNGEPILACRFVCEQINGSPPSPLHEVAHSCGRGNKGCVTPNHLRWATHTENEKDKIAHETSPRGERHGRAKLKEHQVREIRQLAGNISQRAIARSFGVGQQLISLIVTRKLWSHI